MIKKAIWFCFFVLLMSGCTTDNRTVREQKKEETTIEKKEIIITLGSKYELLEKANTYLKNRDYANALINIISAEKAGGGRELDPEIRVFKNNMIEKLNARAMYEKEVIEVGKGLELPLQYMVFYMEDEIIYPAFNIPVTFEMKKGKASITGKSYTNTSGVAECEVSKVESLVENEIIISADVYFDIAGETFYIAKLYREFVLHYKSIKEQAVSFIIFERNIDKVVLNSVSGKLIEDFFVKNGFSVYHGINESNRELFSGAVNGEPDSLKVYRDKLNTELIAFIYIESGFSSKVSEGFYFAKSKIILNIVDVETNKILFNSVVEDIKGAGNSEEKAGRKAINEATEKFIEKLTGQIDSLELKP